jgi:capsular polysaccharide biosynthesis protein
VLAYYFSILRRRAWLVVILTALLVPAIFVALTAGPTTYTSQAVIQVGSGSVTDGVITDGRSYEDPERRIATELEIFTGRTVAEQAAERLRAQGWNAEVGELMESVVATPRGGASAIEVIGTDSDPVRAQQLTAAFVNAYMDYRREAKRAEAERVQADLRTRLAAAGAAQDSQARYDTLAEWLEGVTLRLSVDTSGLELISPPSLPEEPTSAVSPAVAAVASLLGALAVGCGIALALDLARDSIRNREEAEILLPTPALVEMPRVRGDGETWLGALCDPGDPTSSAARGLRLRLGSALTSGRDVRLMVAGADDDGRDTLTVATALAATYGRSASLVLLVADPLEGTAFETLATPAREGSVVAVEVAPEARPTALPGVWQVPASTAADGTPGVLDVHDPARALESYAEAFDVVVIAIPPRADEAEAVAVGQLVQTAVVVGAIGRTPTRRLRRLVTALQGSGASVSGLALTTPAKRGAGRPVRPVHQEDRLPVPTS